MSEAPIATPNPEIKTESINILINNKKCIFYLKSKDDLISLILSESEEDGLSYNIRLTLNELKQMNKFFSLLNTCHDFAAYLKKLYDENKLYFIKKIKEIIINFNVEYFSKKENIEITLYTDNKYNEYLEERIIKLENENKEIKNEINIIKNKNRETENNVNLLKNDINILKKEISELKSINDKLSIKMKDNHQVNFNSLIMKQDEFKLIYSAIKSRINKEIKELKKLYQATIDGESPADFHFKCDNIPNTLTLIKSDGNRRFGGFASECWESPSVFRYKEDHNAFLFSLDKQKIYPYMKDGNALWIFKNAGPTFGFGNKSYSAIYIGQNPIKIKTLITNESNPKTNYNFYGDKNALSEDGSAHGINAIEIEVFQVIFY